MAELTITIPNTKVDLVVEAIGYQDTIIDDEGNETPNPQTKAEYGEEWIINRLKQEVKRLERRKAVENATYTDVNIS